MSFYKEKQGEASELEIGEIAEVNWDAVQQQLNLERTQREDAPNLQKTADVLWSALAYYMDNEFETRPNEEGEEELFPTFPTFESIIERAPEDHKGLLVWFSQNYLLSIYAKRSYYWMSKKLFDVFTKCLEAYVHSTEQMEVLGSRGYILHAIAATFSILIIKLNRRPQDGLPQNIASRNDIVLEGVTVSRYCIAYLMSLQQRNRSYEPITAFMGILESYGDIFASDELVDTESRIHKALDLMLVHQSYDGIETSPENIGSLFFKLFSSNEFLEESYRPLVNDITRASLIFGIFSTIDEYFSEETLIQRNGVVESLWVRINIIWDSLFGQALVTFPTRELVNSIKEKIINLHTASTNFLNTYCENILLDVAVKTKSFRQVTFPALQALQAPQGEDQQEEGAQAIANGPLDYTVSSSSTFGKLSYGVLKYILLNILKSLFISEYAEQHTIVDPQLERILWAHTWRTLHYLARYLPLPGELSKEERDFFELVNAYLDKPDSFEQASMARLDDLEKVLLSIQRPVVLPTDWSALVSLLMSSPMADMRDFLRHRYDTDVPAIYACTFASIKAFHRSLKEIYYIHSMSNEMFEDSETVLIAAHKLETLLSEYYPRIDMLLAKVNQIKDFFEFGEEYEHNGHLRIRTMVQALYELSLPAGKAPTENFLEVEEDLDGDIEETFSLVSLQEFPESLFVMAYMMDNEEKIKNIFPFVPHGPHEVSLASQYAFEFISGGEHNQNTT